MADFTKKLESGATLEVTMASFAEAHKLLKAVAKELETVNLSFGAKGKGLGDVLSNVGGDEAINTIKNIFVRLIASEEIEAALWACMERATYALPGQTVGLKINRETFEDKRARPDYLPVAKEVLVYTVSPFLQNLSSLFSAIAPKNTGTLT